MLTSYFHAGAKISASTEAALNKLFDKYRDDPVNSPDTIQMSGAMTYFNDVGVSIEDVGLLVASEFLACPTLGDISRQGFVEGWGPISATNTAAQRTFFGQLQTALPTPESRANSSSPFRRVYKHTFKLACPAGSKSIPLENAVEFWKMLFGPQGVEWRSSDGTQWLDLYLSFLSDRWKKAINRDLWDQTLLFALKTMEDDTLSWWSEESAWPGVIDDFVQVAKQRGGNAMTN